MARTAAPATPGTDPNAATAGPTSTADFVGDAAETPEQKVARLEREVADMRSMVLTLGRNQSAQAMPEKVPLPDLDSIVKQKPDIPVLTKQGWYVPAVLPQQRREA